jgi:hypothetical protein
MAIRRAMQASPELRDVERRDNDRLAQNFADALVRRGVGISSGRLRAAGRMLLDTAAAVHDEMLVRDGPTARASFRELKRMHRAYLETLPGP